MAESGEQPIAQSSESSQKEAIIGSIGRKIDGFFSEANFQARLADSDVGTIKNVGRLSEAGEIGEHIGGVLRRGQNQTNERVVVDIGRGIKQAGQLVEGQIQLTRTTFRGANSGFDEFSDFMRKITGEWQGRVTKEYLGRIREVLSGPNKQEGKIGELFEEFRQEIIRKIKSDAEELGEKSRSFERQSFDIGDQSIRGLSRVAATAGHNTISERLDTMLHQVKSYYQSSKEAREALPTRFKQIFERTLELENTLKSMFEELAH